MNKIIIFGLMMLLLLTSVLGYDQGDTIRLDALYTEAGVYQPANATITIEAPNGTILISEVGMNIVSDGIFYYDFTIPPNDGEYLVSARFYIDSVFKGLDSRTFDVGEIETLNFLFYPALLICLVLMGIGFITKNGLIGILGGLGMIFLSFMLTGAFFIITIIGGCLISLTMLLIRE
jgi:hypothetical protein